MSMHERLCEKSLKKRAIIEQEEADKLVAEQLERYEALKVNNPQSTASSASSSSSKKTGISCKTSTLPPIGQRRKATEKPSAVKERYTSLSVLQSNQLDTWSELGGSIDLLSSHSTIFLPTRL